MDERTTILPAKLTRREAFGVLAGGTMAAAAIPGGSPGLKRPIPSTGELLPAVGLGSWQTFDVGESRAERQPLRDVLARFASRGARLLDSSPMYGRSESVAGGIADELGIGRSLFFATKVWTTGRQAGVAQMEESFRRLRVDRVCLMQVHNLVDVSTHLATLAEWKAKGRVKYVGVTHYTAGAYPALEAVLTRNALDFVQLNYSLAEREAERRLLGLARDRGVAVLVNRPFAGSGLFDRVRGKDVPSWAASEVGCATWAQFFLKFILGHPAVTCVIPATASVRHLDDNLDAGLGPIPDQTMRRRMAEAFEAL